MTSEMKPKTLTLSELGLVLKWQSFYKWYMTKIPALNDRTPFEALKAGDFDDVRKLVKSYLEPLEYM